MIITHVGSKFLKLQYSALREEIVEVKERVRKEFIIGLIGVPLLVGFAFKFHFPELLAITPVVIVSGSLMLLFEQLSIMRAGFYIREVIEPLSKTDPDIGWESWLESTQYARVPSRIFRFSTAVTFFIYYVFCCIVAIISSLRAFPLWVAVSVTVLYIAGLVFFSFFLLRNYKTHSDFRKTSSLVPNPANDRKSFIIGAADRSYLMAEFCALRSEILGLKSRVVKETTLGLTGIPFLLGGVTLNQELRFLLGLGPVIITAVGLTLVFEHTSLMRAGMYIREKIEPRLAGGFFVGWETFLEIHPEARNAERYFRWSAILALGLYYLIGTKLAADAFVSFKDEYSLYTYVVYLLVFPFLLFTIWVLPWKWIVDRLEEIDKKIRGSRKSD